MSDDKKDLTNISDMSEFLHQENEVIDGLEDSTITTIDEPPPFESSSQSDNAESPDEEASEDEENKDTFGSDDDTFESSDEESDDTFGSGDEDSDDTFGSDDDTFESSDEDSDDTFGSDDDTFGSTDESNEDETSDAAFGDDQTATDLSDLVESEAPVVEPVTQPIDTHTPPTTTTSKQENFQDLRNFAQSIQYGDVSAGGNPPFSIIIKNIIFSEDSEEIIGTLREHGLINAENEEAMQKSISRGSLLISQISEYSAIYLCHKLRRFNVEILMGLSHEIHPPQSYSDNARGLVSKKSSLQNQKDHLTLEESSIDLENIILSTTSILEGYSLSKYLGLVSEHYMIDAEDFELLSDAKFPLDKESPNASNHETLDNQTLQEITENLKQLKEQIDNEEDTDNISLREIYANLASKLKIHALKLKGNAIIGINYQITAIADKDVHNFIRKYKISCTGNAVWATKI